MNVLSDKGCINKAVQKVFRRKEMGMALINIKVMNYLERKRYFIHKSKPVIINRCIKEMSRNFG